jgi:peroxiredoxin
MAETRTDLLILILMGIIILLMVSITGLFIRPTVQSRVLAALETFQAMRMPEGLEVRSKAPDFTLTDIEGREVSLKDFSGRKVLLAFFSPDCPAYVRMYEELRDLSEMESRVQVLMISQGSEEGINRMVEEEGFKFPVLMWEEVFASYKVPGSPFFYVIDEGGIIISGVFASSLSELKELVKAK